MRKVLGVSLLVVGVVSMAVGGLPGIVLGCSNLFFGVGCLKGWE